MSVLPLGIPLRRFYTSLAFVCPANNPVKTPELGQISSGALAEALGLLADIRSVSGSWEESSLKGQQGDETEGDGRAKKLGNCVAGRPEI